MALEVCIQKQLRDFLLDMEFAAEDGVLGILGASGCGKSMTLKCIAGIETPDAGRIVLDGRVLFDSAKKINLPPQKRNVGYMFQDYALFPHMTVEQNLMTGMKTASVRHSLSGKAVSVRNSLSGKTARDCRHTLPGRNTTSGRSCRERARELAVQFQLEELLTARPAELSGGQKQRVAMARLMAAQPEVILLDEPFSALDGYLKDQMLAEMKAELKKRKLPVIFVTHDRDEAFRLCKNICVMDAGAGEAVEEKRQFFAAPGTKNAAVLSGCKNIAAAERMDENHLYAADWNLTIYGEHIPENTAYVGIRAHDFVPEYGGRKPGQFTQNGMLLEHDKEAGAVYLRVETQRVRMEEALFEWNVYLIPAGGKKEVLWKAAKCHSGQKNPPQIPEVFTVQADRILFLRAGR